MGVLAGFSGQPRPMQLGTRDAEDAGSQMLAMAQKTKRSPETGDLMMREGWPANRSSLDHMRAKVGCGGGYVPLATVAA